MWRCRRDPSHTRKRRNGNGCLACHVAGNNRRAAERAIRLLFEDPFDDIVLTCPVREYLRAFDAYLVARRDGLPGTLEAAVDARGDAVQALIGRR